MRKTRFFVTFLGILSLLAGGCSSFQSQWDKAVAVRPTPVDFQGPWQGTWRSGASGHNDVLQCIITLKNDRNFDARFHAKYHRVFTFNYAVPLTVQSTNGIWHFEGSANLGWLAGGVYHYDGTASTTNFSSTYTSKYDHGIFQMTRP